MTGQVCWCARLGVTSPQESPQSSPILWIFERLLAPGRHQILPGIAGLQFDEASERQVPLGIIKRRANYRMPLIVAAWRRVIESGIERVLCWAGSYRSTMTRIVEHGRLGEGT